MSKALEARGLTLEEARGHIEILASHAGGISQAADLIGLKKATLHSAFAGPYGPGEKVLQALYGPTGRDIRPELLGGGTAADVASAAAQPEETAAPVIAAPVCGPDAFGGLTVAELLLRAQRRATLIENELDEALGEIASLQAMALRLGGEHG